MIKALLLIFDTCATWEQIVLARRTWIVILTRDLLPLLVFVSVLEGWSLVQWGRPLGNFGGVRQWDFAQASVFELAQIILSLGVVLLGAKLIKSLGETFYGRYSITQTFTVAAYGLSPLFLLGTLDAFPSVSPWVAWGIGISLSAVAIYHGLPRVMRPDPPHAFGLYVTSLLPLVIITGLTCFLTTWFIVNHGG